MKEYIHVNVRWRMHGLAVAYVDEHREIINQYAAMGYRFVTAIPTEMKINGCVRKMDLIFEKEAL